MKELNYYLEFAEKIIKAYCKKHKIRFDITDEFISSVAYRIMRGEERYSIDKVSEKKRKSSTNEECFNHYLRQCAIFGVRAYIDLYHKKKQKVRQILFSDIDNAINRRSDLSTCPFGFDHSVFQSANKKTPVDILCEEETKQEMRGLLDTYIQSSGLTPNEISVIQQYKDGKSLSAIARDNNVSAQAINMSYQNAINKMSSMVK